MTGSPSSGFWSASCCVPPPCSVKNKASQSWYSSFFLSLFSLFFCCCHCKSLNLVLFLGRSDGLQGDPSSKNIMIYRKKTQKPYRLDKKSTVVFHFCFYFHPDLQSDQRCPLTYIPFLNATSPCVCIFLQGVNAAFDVLLICNVNVYELSQRLLLRKNLHAVSYALPAPPPDPKRAAPYLLRHKL